MHGLQKISHTDRADSLANMKVIFSTWGMPVLNEAFLAGAPKLKAVFYAADTVKGFLLQLPPPGGGGSLQRVGGQCDSSV